MTLLLLFFIKMAKQLQGKEEGKNFFYVAEAPEWICRQIQKEIDDERVALKELWVSKWCKPGFLVMYGITDMKDSTNETYYKVWLYKSMGWFTVRGKEDLDKVVKFVKDKSKLKSLHMYPLDLDSDKWQLTFKSKGDD